MSLSRDNAGQAEEADKTRQDPLEFFRQQTKLMSPMVFEESSDEEVAGLPVNVNEVNNSEDLATLSNPHLLTSNKHLFGFDVSKRISTFSSQFLSNKHFFFFLVDESAPFLAIDFSQFST